MSAFGADFALQEAMFAALIAAAPVTSLLAEGANGIYEAVPDGADLPLLVIGDNELTRGELKACERWVGKITIEAHTQQTPGEDPPRELAKAILAAVENVLDDTLAVTGYDIIVLSNDFTGSTVSPIDNKSVLGRLTYNLDMVQAE